MEYFWVRADKTFSRGIEIKPLTDEELQGKRPITRYVKLSENFDKSVLPDYITTKTIKDRYYLISDNLKEVCSMYNKNQRWMPAVLIDQYSKCHMYWFWSVKTIECISTKTVYSFDKTVSELAINTSILRKENNFAVETKLEKMIIVRLDLAESILRRGYIGFNMEKVLTSGE